MYIFLNASHFSNAIVHLVLFDYENRAVKKETFPSKGMHLPVG